MNDQRKQKHDILCGELVRAVREESEVAVAHHWGVCVKVAHGWRRALEVETYNSGTRMLQHATALEHATPAKMRRLTALARKVRTPKSKRWRQRMSDLVRRRIAKAGPINPRHRLWTAREDRLLGKRTDGELAAQFGRSERAIASRRRALRIALEDPEFAAWTAAEEKLLGTASDAEIARRLGRGERGVQLRRQRLGIPKVGGKAEVRRWKPEEDALLGTRPDREVAQMLGRPLASVQVRRHLKGLKNCAPLRKAWAKEEDKMLNQAADKEPMERTGRSLRAIAHRRAALAQSTPLCSPSTTAVRWRDSTTMLWATRTAFSTIGASSLPLTRPIPWHRR